MASTSSLKEEHIASLTSRVMIFFSGFSSFSDSNSGSDFKSLSCVVSSISSVSCQADLFPTLVTPLH